MQKQLEVVDDTLASYLKFSPNEVRKFTYYTFDTRQAEHWDILGIHYLSRVPLIVDVRLMYIDQDALDWEHFVAERDAPGYITCNPTRYLSIITFFESLLNGEIYNQNKTPNSFSLLDREELLQLHYSLDTVDAAVGIYYRYMFNIEVQDPGMINVIRLPRWFSRYGVQQISSLWFISLPRDYLKDTQFDIISDTDGLGTLRFDQSTLEELILLLKENIKLHS